MMIFRVVLTIVLLVAAGAIASCGPAPTPTAAPLGIGDVPPGVELNGQPLAGGQRIDGLSIWVAADAVPPGTGPATLDALVVDDQGKPVDDARVSFDIDMTNMSHGLNVTPAGHLPNGHYAGQVHFMMMGPWRVIVVVERPNQAPVRARFNFEVR